MYITSRCVINYLELKNGDVCIAILTKITFKC